MKELTDRTIVDPYRNIMISGLLRDTAFPRSVGAESSRTGTENRKNDTASPPSYFSVLPMSTTKQEAIRLICSLPDKSTLEDIMYALYVRDKIDSGLMAIEGGRVLAHEDVKKRFEQI